MKNLKYIEIVLERVGRKNLINTTTQTSLPNPLEANYGEIK
ncbi:Uncharacterised protein [uncultured archaeon]|nr:Uncharacterised protein [uncultured archaeon]